MGTYAAPNIEDAIMHSAGDFMSNQNLASQIASRAQQSLLTQQQTAGAELENQQRRLDMQDQQKLRDIFSSDPQNATRIYTGDAPYLQSLGLQPKTVFGLLNSSNEYRKNLLTNTLDQNKVQSEALGSINDTFAGLQQFKKPDSSLDLDRINQEAPNAIQRLQAQGKFAQAGVAPPQWQPISDPAQFDSLVSHMGGTQALHDKVIAEQEAAAKAKKEGAEATKAQLVTQAMQDALKDPSQGEGLIDKALPATVDPQANASYKAAYRAAIGAGDLDGASKVVGTAASHAATIAQKLNPKIRGAEISDAVTKARIEREGDVPALAGVPPQLAGQVTAAAGKLDVDYAKAKAASDGMQDFIDLAESGNKAAAANVPLAGVLQINTANGTKRINRTEIDQYQGAGSLFDQISGKLGKLTAGQPIPKDVLEDMRQLSGIVGQRAWQEYNDGLTALQKRDGYKGGPVLEAPRPIRPASQYQVNQQVTVKTAAHPEGEKVTIKSINKDGTFSY